VGFTAICYFLSLPSAHLRSDILLTISIVFAISGVVLLLFREANICHGYSFSVLRVQAYLA
jgi:hypothetical protein